MHLKFTFLLELACLKISKIDPFDISCKRRSFTQSQLFISFQSTVLGLIKDNITKNPDSKGFLIDGYPRDVNQGVEFEKTVSV